MMDSCCLCGEPLDLVEMFSGTLDEVERDKKCDLCLSIEFDRDRNRDDK